MIVRARSYNERVSRAPGRRTGVVRREVRDHALRHGGIEYPRGPTYAAFILVKKRSCRLARGLRGGRCTARPTGQAGSSFSPSSSAYVLQKPTADPALDVAR